MTTATTPVLVSLTPTTPFDPNQERSLEALLPPWWIGPQLTMSRLMELLGISGIDTIGRSNLFRIANAWIQERSPENAEYLRHRSANVIDHPLFPSLREASDLPEGLPVMVWIPGECFDASRPPGVAGDWYPGTVYNNTTNPLRIMVMVSNRMVRRVFESRLGYDPTPDLNGYGVEYHPKSPLVASTKDFERLWRATFPSTSELWVRTSNSERYHDVLVKSLLR